MCLNCVSEKMVAGAIMFTLKLALFSMGSLECILIIWGLPAIRGLLEADSIFHGKFRMYLPSVFFKHSCLTYYT